MTDEVPASELVARVERLVRRRAVSWRRVRRGYTRAERWVVAFSDGTSAFVKAAVDEETAAWLRAELRVYGAANGGFLPRLVAYDAEPLPWFAIEDLSSARWPPPWRAGDVDRLFGALDALHGAPPPPGLPPVASHWDLRTGWRAVVDDPRSFLSLGLCDEAWFAHASPTLVAAEAAVRLDGDAFVHQDVRSDNVCFAGGRTLLVDWSWASRGDAELDTAAVLPSLHAEGGPRPDDVLPHAGEAAAALSGWWASRAGPPPPPDSRVREVQRSQLEVALPWACRALGLAMPRAARR